MTRVVHHTLLFEVSVFLTSYKYFQKEIDIITWQRESTIGKIKIHV